MQMNASPTYGFNWIKNLENMKDDDIIKIYPTEDAGLRSGRIYVALQANKELTPALKTLHKIWI